jgi:hypothetical protein
MEQTSTTTTYVQNHEDAARSLIRALVDATHFFKTKKPETITIIKKHCTELLKMQKDEDIGALVSALSERN